MATGKCPECGSAYGKTAKFCKDCGYTLVADLESAGKTAVEPLTEDSIAALDSTDLGEEMPLDLTSGESTAAEEEPVAAAPPAASVENGSYALEILGGLSAGECVSVLEKQPVVVGSDEAASLRVQGDENISRRHAAFTVRDGKLFVSDKGSTNGTFICVHEDRELVPGDTLTLGNTLVQVRKNGTKSDG